MWRDRAGLCQGSHRVPGNASRQPQSSGPLSWEGDASGALWLGSPSWKRTQHPSPMLSHRRQILRREGPIPALPLALGDFQGVLMARSSPIIRDFIWKKVISWNATWKQDLVDAFIYLFMVYLRQLSTQAWAGITEPSLPPPHLPRSTMKLLSVTPKSSRCLRGKGAEWLLWYYD